MGGRSLEIGKMGDLSFIPNFIAGPPSTAVLPREGVMNPRSVLERPPRQPLALSRRQRWVVWRSWVLATTLGEFVGLELISAASALINRIGSLSLIPALLGVGTLEGAVLGLAQWLVLRRYIKPVGGWVLATTGGAILAWLVGVRFSILIAVTFFGGAGRMETGMLPLLLWVFLLGA
ncbi:MAG: hypothetical protein VKJ46_02670, partial [Leptolyngbyaceae bacterium]|nr:hypothetical protein [Leptolyngbyaceae bacterium]